MMKSLALMLAAAAGIAGCAQTPAETARAAEATAATQQSLEKALAGLVPDRTTLSCLPSLPTAHVEGYGPTLIYRVSSRLKYRNDTAGGCEGVQRGDILVTTSNGGRTCQGDISRTVDQSSRFTTGSCALGPFVAYRKP